MKLESGIPVVFLESISLSLGCYGGEGAEGKQTRRRDFSHREKRCQPIFLVVYDFRFFTFIAIFYLFPDI